MTELTRVKTTDDGIDIYVNADDGKFVAVIGECHCGNGRSPIQLTHSHYCNAKTITRRNMAELVREVAKTGVEKVAVRAILVDQWRGSRIVEVVGVEPGGKYAGFRYRGKNGGLFNPGADVRVYSDDAWQKLQAVTAELERASLAMEAVRGDRDLLPTLTREKLRELQAAPPEANDD